MHQLRRVAAVALTVFTVGLLAAAPANAQNRQEGLVNVALEDITVQLPISIAANLCDINVAVLAEIDDAAGACEATAESAASRGRSGNGSTTQQGLVNVLVQDVVVQVPIALAANVCDLNVAVLADIEDDAAACNADADSNAVVDTNRLGPAGRKAAAERFDPIDLATVVGGRLLDNDLTTDTGLPL